MNDSELDQLLKDCNPVHGTPAGFRNEVWLRIERAESTDRSSIAGRALRRVAEWLTLPPVAAATCAATVAAGVWLGMKPENPGTAGEMAYVRSISPFVHPASHR